MDMDRSKHVVDDHIPETGADATDANPKNQIQITTAGDGRKGQIHGNGGGTSSTMTMAKKAPPPTTTTTMSTSSSVEARAASTVLKLCGGDFEHDVEVGDARSSASVTTRRRAARNLRDKLRRGLLTESSFAALSVPPSTGRPQPRPIDTAECVVRGLVLEVGTLRRLLEGGIDEEHDDHGDDGRWQGGHVGSNLKLLGRHRRRRQRIEESEDEVVILLELLRCAVRGGSGGQRSTEDGGGGDGDEAHANNDVARVLSHLRSTMISAAEVDGAGGTVGPSSDVTTMNRTIIPLVDAILSSLGPRHPPGLPSSTAPALPARFFGKAAEETADQAGSTPIDAAMGITNASQEIGHGRVGSSGGVVGDFAATEKGPLGSSLPTGEVAPSFAHTSGADPHEFHGLGYVAGRQIATPADAMGAEPTMTSAWRVQQRIGPPVQNVCPTDSFGFGVEPSRGALEAPTSSSSPAPQLSYNSSQNGVANFATASGAFSPPSRDFHNSNSVPVPNGSFRGNPSVPPPVLSGSSAHGQYTFGARNDSVAAPSSTVADSSGVPDHGSTHGLSPIFTLGCNLADCDSQGTDTPSTLTESQRDVLFRLASLLDSYRHRRLATMRGAGGGMLRREKWPRQRHVRDESSSHLFATASGAAADRLYLDLHRCEEGVNVTNVEEEGEGEIVALLGRLTYHELADMPMAALLGNTRNIGGDGGSDGGCRGEGERFIVALLNVLGLLTPSGGGSPPMKRRDDGVRDGTGAADGIAGGIASNMTAAGPSASSSRLEKGGESVSHHMVSPWRQQEMPREGRRSDGDSHGLVLCILRFLEALLNRLSSLSSYLSSQAQTGFGRFLPPVRRDAGASSPWIDGVSKTNDTQQRTPTCAASTNKTDALDERSCTVDRPLGTSGMPPKRTGRGFSLGGVALAIHRATSAHMDSSHCSIKAIASSICVLSFPLLSDFKGDEACMVGGLQIESPNESLHREKMTALSAARVSSVLSSLVSSAICTMRSFSGEAHSAPQSVPSSLLLGVRYLCTLPRDAASVSIDVPASEASTRFDKCYVWSECNVSASASAASPSVTVPSLLAEALSTLNGSESSIYARIAKSNVLASSCRVAVAEPLFDPCDVSCDAIAGLERMLRETNGHSAGSTSSSSTRAMVAKLQRTEAHIVVSLPILAKKRVLGKYAEIAWHGEVGRVIRNPPATEEDHDLRNASLSLLSRLLPYTSATLLRLIAYTCATSVLFFRRMKHCSNDGQSSRQSLFSEGQVHTESDGTWAAHHAMLMFLRLLFQCCCNGILDEVPDQPIRNENDERSEINIDKPFVRLTEALVRGFVLPEKDSKDQDITERIPSRLGLAAMSVLSQLFAPRCFHFCSRLKSGNAADTSEGKGDRKLEEGPSRDLAIQSLVTIVASRQHTLDRDSFALAALLLLRTSVAGQRFLSNACWRHDGVGVSWLFRLTNDTGLHTMRAMAYGIIGDLLLSQGGATLLENGLASSTRNGNVALLELAARVGCNNAEPPLVRAECFGLVANAIEIGGCVSNGDLMNDVISSIKQIVMHTTKDKTKKVGHHPPGARGPLEQNETSLAISYLAVVRLLRVIILSWRKREIVCVGSKVTPPSVNGMASPCNAATRNPVDTRNVDKGQCFQLLTSTDFFASLSGAIDIARPYADRSFLDVNVEGNSHSNYSPRDWQALAIGDATNAAIFDIFSAVLARDDELARVVEDSSHLLLQTLQVLTNAKTAPRIADAELDCFSSACQCLARIFLSLRGNSIQPLAKIFNQESRRALGISLQHVLAHCVSMGGKLETIESIYDLLTSALCSLSPEYFFDIFLPTNGTNGDVTCSLLQTIVEVHMSKVFGAKTSAGTVGVSDEDKHSHAPKSLRPTRNHDSALSGHELRAKSAFILGRFWEATVDSTSGLLDGVAGALTSGLLSELSDDTTLLAKVMKNKEDSDGHSIMVNVVNFRSPASGPLRQHGRNCKSLCIDICLALSVLRSVVRRTSANIVACRNNSLSTIVGKIFPFATTAETNYKGEAMIELVLGTIANFAVFNSKSKQSLCSGKKTVLHTVSELALRRTRRSGGKIAALTPLAIDLSFNILRVVSLPNSPARGILAAISCYTKVVKTLISLLPLARKYKAKDKMPAKSLWHSRVFGGMALLVNATLDEEWRKTVLIDWAPFADFLTIAVEMKGYLGFDLQNATLLLLRNLCLGPPRKSAVLLNQTWIQYIIESCRSENESTRHTAITSLWCLCYKSEKAVSIIKSKCDVQKILHAPLGQSNKKALASLRILLQ